jgi:transcriptional regulator with GAF, ATPase, and Fis domain
MPGYLVENGLIFVAASALSLPRVIAKQHHRVRQITLSGFKKCPELGLFAQQILFMIAARESRKRQKNHGTRRQRFCTRRISMGLSTLAYADQFGEDPNYTVLNSNTRCANPRFAKDASDSAHLELHLKDKNRPHVSFPGIVGQSAALLQVLDLVEMVAPTDSTVLLLGETGTGKEVFAKTIHEASSRRQKRFVALNCATIPTALMESELFGHERGAFTGAATQSVGRFQSADGGTLFLDEIGDLPLELQPKLLRALQEKQFERLGGGRTVRVDVRVIAATNQDLWQMVQERRFRADLFYRLNVFPISLPPLRQREDDIPLLIDHFVQSFAKRQGKSIDRIPDDVMKILKRHHWPGNIRELQNVIERAVIMTTGPVLALQTTELLTANVEAVSIRTLEDAQRAHISATLRETNWVVGGPRGAAARLGLARTTLITMMQRLGISRETSGQAGGEPDRPCVTVPRERYGLSPA